MKFFRGSSAWWSRARMVRVIALDIKVSLRNPMAMLVHSITSVKTLYKFPLECILEPCWMPFVPTEQHKIAGCITTHVYHLQSHKKFEDHMIF